MHDACMRQHQSQSHTGCSDCGLLFHFGQQTSTLAARDVAARILLPTVVNALQRSSREVFMAFLPIHLELFPEMERPQSHQPSDYCLDATIPLRSGLDRGIVTLYHTLRAQHILG